MNALHYGEFSNLVILNATLHLKTKGGSRYLIQRTGDDLYNIVKIKGLEIGYMREVRLHLYTAAPPAGYDEAFLPLEAIAPSMRLHIRDAHAFVTTTSVTEIETLEPIETRVTAEGIALVRRLG